MLKKTLRKINKSKKTRKNQKGGSRRSARVSTNSKGPFNRSKFARKTIPPHIEYKQRKTAAMENVIAYAGPLKATGTTKFETYGKIRTSYKPEEIIKLLIKKGHNLKLAKNIAEQVSKYGIGATASKLGVEGYNRNLARQNASQIMRILNPEAALSSARAGAENALKAFNTARQSSGVNPNFGISSR